MSYATTDWEAEATLIKRAFGLESECEFVEKFEVNDNGIIHKVPAFRRFSSKSGVGVVLPDSGPTQTMYFFCNYFSGEGRSFFVSPFEDHQEITVIIAFAPDGNIYGQVRDAWHAQRLAKGLYHLGLLTPKVEAKLGTIVSSHQKMEWTLEYKERYDL